MRLQVSPADQSTLQSVVDWCVKNATATVEGWLVQHKDDGTHANITADSLTAETVAATESLAVGRNAADTAALLTVAVNDSGPAPVVDITAPGAGNAINVYAASGILLQVPVSDATAAAVGIFHTGININSGLGDVELVKGQLTFPATQNPSTDANTLDDYEEGAVTPTSDDITYAATSSLVVTKIGGLVVIQYRLVWPATADANTAEFDLPFTPLNDPGNRGGTICNTNTAAGNPAIAFVVNTPAAKAVLRGLSGAAVTNATMSGATVLGELSYRAAS